MPAFPLLWPIIAMAALIFVVWFVLLVQRFRHMRVRPPVADTFATPANARRYFEPVELSSNNLINLFEMPVLFFVVTILLLETDMGNDIQVMLAWAFVALRVVHSWAHIAGRVLARARIYALSVVVLLAMWVGFTVDAVTAARAYNETMSTLEAQQPI